VGNLLGAISSGSYTGGGLNTGKSSKPNFFDFHRRTDGCLNSTDFKQDFSTRDDIELPGVRKGGLEARYWQ
jgi:hypothetical protein